MEIHQVEVKVNKAALIVLISVCCALTISLCANVVLWKHASDNRRFYEMATIAWVKQVGGIKNQQELDQLIGVVKKSQPKLETGNAIVNFGFIKDPAGAWKLTQ